MSQIHITVEITFLGFFKNLCSQSQFQHIYDLFPVGIILINKPHRIDFQIKSKFYNDSQLTIYVSGSPKNRIEHVLICLGSATRYRSEMEMQVS